MYIENNRALHIPKDVETLKSSIVHIAKMLDGEAIPHLMAAFGLAKKQACILHWIYQELDRPARKIKLDDCPEIKHYTTNSRTTISSSLKSKLRQSFIQMNEDRKNVKITEAGLKKIDSALSSFDQTMKKVFKILQATTDNISEITLPDNRIILQSMLTNLLKLYRGNPAESPIKNLPLSTPEKFVASTFYTAWLEGKDFVSFNRIQNSLYPPFLKPSKNARVITSNAVRQLCNRYISDDESMRKHPQGIIPIPAAMQEMFSQFPQTPPDRRAAHQAARRPQPDYNQGSGRPPSPWHESSVPSQPQP